jgi:ABC-type multidrug transport system permease subunit
MKLTRNESLLIKGAVSWITLIVIVVICCYFIGESKTKDSRDKEYTTSERRENGMSFAKTGGKWAVIISCSIFLCVALFIIYITVKRS